MKHMKKIMALVIALVMVFAMGVTVFAAPTDASNDFTVDSVEVSGIKTGNTLTLYKIVQFNLDAATNEFSYTLATGLPAAYDTIDELAALTPDGYTLAGASDTIRVAADALAYGIANGDITPIGTAVTATAASDKATITDLPAGWYVAVVTGTEDTGIIYQNMIIDAMPQVENLGTASATYASADDVSFEVKHVDETITKTVGSDKAESTDKYSVGDTVPFEITTAIPNYPNPAKVATFKITDTPSDLTDDITTGFTVKVNGVEVARSTSLEGTNATYTVTQSGDGFIIEFAKAYILAHPGQSVVVNYNAVIKDSATIANDGLTASNTANLTFNPNPNDTGEVEPEDGTELYTYGVTVLKHEDGDTTKKLAGAKFILYAADGTTVVRAETEVNADGQLTWDGLEAGTYKLVETKAPAGYRLDSTPITVELSKTTATGDDPLKTGTQTYVLEKDVPNTPGATLPSTGGIGTTLFYIIGAVVVAGAVIALVARRKARAEQ